SLVPNLDTINSFVRTLAPASRSQALVPSLVLFVLPSHEPGPRFKFCPGLIPVP
uniref:Uncharacterized protein n=1 Tax=Cannabis sativa TaxID=3483 RepID=A0A803QRZ1_CANSA